MLLQDLVHPIVQVQLVEALQLHVAVLICEYFEVGKVLLDHFFLLIEVIHVSQFLRFFLRNLALFDSADLSVEICQFPPSLELTVDIGLEKCVVRQLLLLEPLEVLPDFSVPAIGKVFSEIEFHLRFAGQFRVAGVPLHSVKPHRVVDIARS